MPAIRMDIPVSRVLQPLIAPRAYKGSKGGRSRGGSHYFAGQAVRDMVCDPTLRFVCIREVQRSLKFSAKSLVESKIREFGVASSFRILETEIRRVGGTGVMIFEGMQDHTADSIKSLEGFKRAWVEEAQSLSQRSIDLLTPTIREDGSEIWFSWNPDQPTDAVEKLFAEGEGDPDFLQVHSTYLQNPFCPAKMKKEAERMQRLDPDRYDHIWLGLYNLKSQAKVLAGKWRIDEFEPGPEWDGPYHGGDYGFSQDPTAAVRLWIHNERLFVEFESWEIGLELDDTAGRWAQDIPGISQYIIRADNARPESTSYLRRHGLPKIISAPKGKGSVEDGIAFLRQFEEIVIHPRCTRFIEEARTYSYKIDKKTGDVLPDLVDADNHLIDAARYALAPLIRSSKRFVWR